MAAKHALEAGFDVTVLEASDDLGGQWQTTAAHSGVWPGMRTNTSRHLTAFGDFPVPDDHALHPFAEQIKSYLESYADSFGVTDRIRFGHRVRALRPGWFVDDEPFDAVIVASGRFHTPRIPPALTTFTGELLHAYDYPGAEAFRDRRTLVLGNGVSGHEIASDVAVAAPVISSYRKPRYVLQKVVKGVSSDWQWYTHVGALRRTLLPREEFGRALRERVVRVAGNPADFGAPAPDPDILVAGHSLCQDYLTQVRDGAITCRPAIASVEGQTVTFTDGSRASVDVIICATGYDLDIPYLGREIVDVTGPRLNLYHRTFHPDLPGLAVVGQFACSGPYFPLLELQARWIANVWSGLVPVDEFEMRASVSTEPPALDSHDALAATLAGVAGVAPVLEARPELVEPLLFGPLLPSRYRLDGPGAAVDAPGRFLEDVASSPRAAVEPDDVACLPRLGLGELAVSLAKVMT